MLTVEYSDELLKIIRKIKELSLKKNQIFRCEIMMNEFKNDRKKTKKDIEILKKLRESVNYNDKDGFLKDAKEKRKGKRY
jgi:hypothetical protein